MSFVGFAVVVAVIAVLSAIGAVRLVARRNSSARRFMDDLHHYAEQPDDRRHWPVIR